MTGLCSEAIFPETGPEGTWMVDGLKKTKMAERQFHYAVVSFFEAKSARGAACMQWMGFLDTILRVFGLNYLFRYWQLPNDYF